MQKRNASAYVSQWLFLVQTLILLQKKKQNDAPLCLANWGVLVLVWLKNWIQVHYRAARNGDKCVRAHTYTRYGGCCLPRFAANSDKSARGSFEPNRCLREPHSLLQTTAKPRGHYQNSLDRGNKAHAHAKAQTQSRGSNANASAIGIIGFLKIEK